MNTSIHTEYIAEREERISLREWKCDIPRLQQYVQLHRPEQPSITYLTLALIFFNEAKIYIKNKKIISFIKNENKSLLRWF